MSGPPSRPDPWQFFKAAHLVRASEHLVEQVKDAIRSGLLVPGDRLPAEREMMQMFGVSRPTVREALRVLESLGLVQVRVGQAGTVVAASSASQLELPLELLLIQKQISLRELVEFRETIEIFCVRSAARRATAEDLERLRSAMLAVEDSMSHWDRMHEADVKFHVALADAAHNRLAAMVMKVLRDLLSQVIGSGWRALNAEQSEHEKGLLVSQHRRIYETVAKNCPDEGQIAVREHLQRFRQIIAEGALLEQSAQEESHV